MHDTIIKKDLTYKFTMLLKDMDKANIIFEVLQANGHQSWFVGGCVRDSLIGMNPKDIDICTQANPDEQIETYTKNNMKYIETGLQHGTITVLIDDEPFEVTSLRTENNHDGRHADVSYTRDLNDDLLRRDLTINAMAMTVDGDIIDPFGGKDDLLNGNVKFVGDANSRITEDYLRILRYFRFYGRFGKSVDKESFNAIVTHKAGLNNISIERIWSEVSKIVSSKNASMVLSLMEKTGVLSVIDFPINDYKVFDDAVNIGIKNPALMMGLYNDHKSKIYTKWSKSEMNSFEFSKTKTKYNKHDAMIDYFRGNNIDDINDVLRFYNQPMITEDKPVFPVSGNDLIAKGFEQGKELGVIMKKLKQDWFDSNFTLGKDELLK